MTTEATPTTKQNRNAPKNGAPAQAKPNDPYAEWRDDGMERANPPYYFWRPTVIEENKETGDRIEKRNPIQGFVLSTAQRPWSNDPESYQKEIEAGSPGDFVAVYITKPGTIVTGHDKTQPPRVAQIGDIVWVDLRFDLKTLKNKTPTFDAQTNKLKAMYKFAAIPNRKDKIKGGREVWKFDLYGKWLFTSSTECPKLPEIVEARDLAWESVNDPNRQLPPADPEEDGRYEEPPI
jgi:hypothetical protein